MTSIVSNNKRIAKNTLMLYIRMFFIMAVQLYTSRIVLKTLGVEDYGIYNVVGGIIGMAGFIYSAMSSATQRYLTYELGRPKEHNNIENVFVTSIQIHLIIAFIIVIASETIGLWFLYNKMIISQERIEAALWVFQASILSTAIIIVSVPYNALIIAHEKMSAFAYISVIEVTLKLLIIYPLTISGFDKLKLYAILTLCVQLIIRFIYSYYCKKHLANFNFTLTRVNIKLLKEMLSFASWNMWGSCASVLYSQGINLLLNVFFGPTVNAARAVAVQVENAILQFSTNFQMAINPQITKSFAQGDLNYMHKLVSRSSRFTFILLYLLSFPIIIETDFILRLWLNEVPEHSVTFLRLILITAIIDSMARPLMQAASATGKIRKYQSIVGSVLLTIVPIAYITLKIGASAESVFIVHLIICCLAFIIRLYIIRPMIKLNLVNFITNTILRALIISALSLPVPILLHYCIENSFLRSILTIIIAIFIVLILSYCIGIDYNEKKFIKNKIQYILN